MPKFRLPPRQRRPKLSTHDIDDVIDDHKPPDLPFHRHIPQHPRSQDPTLARRRLTHPHRPRRIPTASTMVCYALPSTRVVCASSARLCSSFVTP
eukprot:scaffold17507_cov60-Phaeocystis_antarctica.AAC.1